MTGSRTLGYSREMKRLFVAIAFLLLTGVAPAQPPSTDNPLLTRLLSIAEPDQIAAYSQLHLSERQQRELQSAAMSFLPRVKKAQSEPTGIFRLIPEALGVVDGILTPDQRPLARKLVPRGRQWAQLRALYDESCR